MELKDLRSFKKLEILDTKLAVQVKSVYDATKETINSIATCHNNYTMHDMEHGLRVASYMEDLAFGLDEAFDNNIENFNAFEIALLILSAILHDIGMFIRPEDKTNIKKNIIKYTSSLTYDGVLNVVNNCEENAIKEIIRITHADRINDFIDYDFNGYSLSKILMLDDKYPYSDDVATICVAHGKNYEYLKNIRSHLTKGNYSYNLQFLAALLRIADYLDLDKQRTPILWYKIMRIDGFSKEEWEKHFIIHNEKKLKKYIDNKLQIFFEGKSLNAKIHRKYLRYIDELKVELENADTLLNTTNTEKKYKFNISTKIDDNVATEGFKYSDLRLNLDYSSITELLMGKNIYGDNKLGLRELIQNSIDACELMKEIQRNSEEEFSDPKITIIISKSQNYVKIKDFGIGMTLDIVKKHFLNIGKSYYKSNEYRYENYQYKPIGQYGIGFLACFLLSDNVIVKTKYYKNNEISQIELEKSSEYVVTNTEETGNFSGTEIILDYDKFFNVFNNIAELVAFLEKYFFTTIPIQLVDKDNDDNSIIIKNCCNKIIENKIEKDITHKYEEINCKNYSNIIDGIIKICDTQKNRQFIINSLSINDNHYLYNNETKKFEKYNDKIELNLGYYYYVEYAILDHETYETISKTRKTTSKKRSAIISQGKKVFLIIKFQDSIDYVEADDSTFQIAINNVPIQTILADSGLSFYEELINSYEYFNHIFIHGNKYVNLQYCYLGDFTFHEDNSDFYLYNKGILIKHFIRNACLLPYALKAFGVVNYKGNDIKLDVSRNLIINGKKQIINEISNVILKRLKQKNTNEDWNKMLDAIITYNDTE